MNYDPPQSWGFLCQIRIWRPKKFQGTPKNEKNNFYQKLSNQFFPNQQIWHQWTSWGPTALEFVSGLHFYYFRLRGMGKRPEIRSQLSARKFSNNSTFLHWTWTEWGEMFNSTSIIVKLGSRSKVYLKSLIRNLDLELVAIIAMSPPPPTRKLFWAE